MDLSNYGVVPNEIFYKSLLEFDDFSVIDLQEIRKINDPLITFIVRQKTKQPAALVEYYLDDKKPPFEIGFKAGIEYKPEEFPEVVLPRDVLWAISTHKTGWIVDLCVERMEAHQDSSREFINDLAEIGGISSSYAGVLAEKMIEFSVYDLIQICHEGENIPSLATALTYCIETPSKIFEILIKKRIDTLAIHYFLVTKGIKISARLFADYIVELGSSFSAECINNVERDDTSDTILTDAVGQEWLNKYKRPD